MSEVNFTVKDLQTGVNSMIAVDLAPKGTKLPKNLEAAARQFKELVEGIDAETQVIGNEERSAVYNGLVSKDPDQGGASGIYEDADAAFPDPEEGSGDPDPEPEEPKPAARKAANSKGKDMASTKDKKPAAKAASKPAAKAKDKKPAVKASGNNTKPGVVNAVVECLQKASKTKPISKDQIVTALVKKFPDRDAEKLGRTATTFLVPSVLAKHRDLKLIRVGERTDRKYYIG